MPKNPTGAPFIIASKNICFAKQISKSIPMLLSSFTPKLKTFLKVINFYQIITSIGSDKTLTPSFDH